MGKVYCEGGQFGLLLYHGRLDLREREEIKFQVVDLHDWTKKRKKGDFQPQWELLLCAMSSSSGMRHVNFEFPAIHCWLKWQFIAIWVGEWESLETQAHDMLTIWCLASYDERIIDFPFPSIALCTDFNIILNLILASSFCASRLSFAVADESLICLW